MCTILRMNGCLFVSLFELTTSMLEGALNYVLLKVMTWRVLFPLAGNIFTEGSKEHSNRLFNSYNMHSAQGLM
jgi:hypothetical protein